MEAQDLDFEARIRALERLSGGEGRRGAAALDGQRSRAGGCGGASRFRAPNHGRR